jgi:hypothetical protein
LKDYAETIQVNGNVPNAKTWNEMFIRNLRPLRLCALIKQKNFDTIDEAFRNAVKEAFEIKKAKELTALWSTYPRTHSGGGKFQKDQGFHEKSTVQSTQSTGTPALTLPCFNCGNIDHTTKDCKAPIDQKKIDSNREKWNELEKLKVEKIRTQKVPVKSQDLNLNRS